MKVKVNTALDVVIGFATHYGPIAPVGPLFSFEFGKQHWPPGFWLHKNKLTHTVKHRKRTIVQDGHDLGPLILHLTIPLVLNPWYIKIYPFSGCKVLFSCSSVKADGTPVGCTMFWPYLPMMPCWEPLSLPTAFPVTAHVNTVTVGMSLLDLIAGLFAIVLSIVLEKILPSGKKYPAIKNVYGNKSFIKILFTPHLRKFLLVQFRRKIVDSFFKGVVKSTFNSVAGLFTSSLRGDPTYKLSIKLPVIASASVTVNKDLASGKLKVKTEVLLPLVKVDSDKGLTSFRGKVLGQKETVGDGQGGGGTW